MKSILVQLDLSQAACIAAMLLDPPTVVTHKAAEIAATKATAVEGAKTIDAALEQQEKPVEMRQGAWSSIRDRSKALWIDSGWDTHGVTLDFRTKRGDTITLSVEDWRKLVSEVEQIIAHCEVMRKKSHITHSQTGHDLESLKG